MYVCTYVWYIFFAPLNLSHNHVALSKIGMVFIRLFVIIAVPPLAAATIGDVVASAVAAAGAVAVAFRL